MARPITLFTGQWADLPFTEMCRLASEWGYDGLEVACWGDHLDVVRAAEDDGYVRDRLDLLEKHDLRLFAISNHLAGQAVCDDPIDERHRAIDVEPVERGHEPLRLGPPLRIPGDTRKRGGRRFRKDVTGYGRERRGHPRGAEEGCENRLARPQGGAGDRLGHLVRLCHQRWDEDRQHAVDARVLEQQRKRAPVDFSVGIQRQAVEFDQRCRHEPGLDAGTQCLQDFTRIDGSGAGSAEACTSTMTGRERPLETPVVASALSPAERETDPWPTTGVVHSAMAAARLNSRRPPKK